MVTHIGLLKTALDLLCTTMQKMAKRNELMSEPAPPIGIKGHTSFDAKRLGSYLVKTEFQHLDETSLMQGDQRLDKKNFDEELEK